MRCSSLCYWASNGVISCMSWRELLWYECSYRLFKYNFIPLWNWIGVVYLLFKRLKNRRRDNGLFKRILMSSREIKYWHKNRSIPCSGYCSYCRITYHITHSCNKIWNMNLLNITPCNNSYITRAVVKCVVNRTCVDLFLKKLLFFF